MNSIKLFEFEHENLECIVLDEEPLFNPFSVGKCLDLKESSVRQYLSEMGNDERFDLKNKDEETAINLKFINDHPRFLLRESGLYQLIFKSRKPEAQRFVKWVTNVVLPSIRKTGSYHLESTIEKQLETTFQGVKILTGVNPEEIARVQNESWRTKLANLINDIAKREQISTKSLYEKLYFLFASETGFHIPELAKEAKVTNSYYLKQHELSAKMLYEFALGYFYKDKRFVELINLNPDQKTLVDFKGDSEC